jgi:predicted Zn-dependent protease
MKKAIIQGLITILLFFGAWYALTQVDWLSLFKIQKITNKTEQKLGELFWEVFKKTEQENKDTPVVNSIDSIVIKICKENKIDREKIKVHILKSNEINAFALPDGHLVIYSELILNSENQQELAGVICHEIAHIELNHVMKKLVKEIGLSVLISMTTGNGGAEIIKETAKMLSSSAFDRGLEKEADLKAVDYMINAKLNPESFANFLYRLSDKEHEITNYVTWVNTHPEPIERSEYIIEYSKGKTTNYEAVLSNESWNRLKAKLKD